mgnify:CR=1 FL=1|jgi:two-component system, CAI-1 autoinducer sensor kinase/phosphatase CqsS
MLFHTLYSAINRSLSESAEYFLPHALYISIIGVIGFPSYYWIWTYIFPQPYENLPLRLFGSLLFAGLSLVHFKPTWVRASYANFYWLITMTYALPFFFTYMLFMNNGNMVWAMSMMAGLALLILLAYNWVLFTTVFSLGLLLALFAYVATSSEVVLSNYLIQLPIYIFLIVTASITFYFPYKLKQEKLKVLASVGAEICHELRTPLMTIQNNAYGLNKNLPKLLHAYDLAKTHNLVTEIIRPDALKALEHSIQHIKKEVSHSNTIIDMLLMNLRKTELNTDNFAYLSMSNTIQEALERYPFDSPKSKQVVKANLTNDFVFFGSDILMMHVIFNLIKNALAFTNDATKTSIDITLDSDNDANYIYFRDNGKGISQLERLSIFENFYSTNKKGINSGTGIGLAFCKKVLTSFNAKIMCYSEPGEYTKFVLSFPKQQTIDGI